MFALHNILFCDTMCIFWNPILSESHILAWNFSLFPHNIRFLRKSESSLNLERTERVINVFDGKSLK